MLQNEAKELLRVRNYVNNVLSVATGQPVEKIQHDFNRNKLGAFDCCCAAARVNLPIAHGMLCRVHISPRRFRIYLNLLHRQPIATCLCFLAGTSRRRAHRNTVRSAASLVLF